MSWYAWIKRRYPCLPVYAVFLLANMLQIMSDKKSYFSGFFPRPPFLCGGPFLVCYSHQDLLRLVGPIKVAQRQVWQVEYPSTNTYLLLMATPAKPDTVIQIVTSFSTSLLTARPTLDIFHVDGAVSCWMLNQWAELYNLRWITCITRNSMLAVRLSVAWWRWL